MQRDVIPCAILLGSLLVEVVLHAIVLLPVENLPEEVKMFPAIGTAVGGSWLEGVEVVGVHGLL